MTRRLSYHPSKKRVSRVGAHPTGDYNNNHGPQPAYGRRLLVDAAREPAYIDQVMTPLSRSHRHHHHHVANVSAEVYT